VWLHRVPLQLKPYVLWLAWRSSSQRAPHSCWEFESGRLISAAVFALSLSGRLTSPVSPPSPLPLPRLLLCYVNIYSPSQSKTPPYYCHEPKAADVVAVVEDETCETDTDCQSYCENDPTKTPPYSCHAFGGDCETGRCPLVVADVLRCCCMPVCLRV
jgi:hypothetical protein